MAEGYQVIARRWRPQQFDEIVGQEHIVRTLKNAIETNRIGHAYLFVGPRGTGKTTTARIFAKALNCTGGPKVAPPDDDPICKAIVNGSCLDVIEIDAATNRGIDDAKDIRDQCQYAPAQCKFKVFIIDEIHQLSKDAFNALLKTLEEPPPHIKFIFATTEVDKLLPTITSRCQRFEFQPVPEDKIAGRLRQIVNADGVEADDAALLAIARLANGGMRDSQSILDQVISFCGKKISAANVADIYGLVPATEIDALAGALAAGDFPKTVEFVDRFANEGRDLHRALQHTQTRVREALLDAIRNGGTTTSLGAPLATEQLLRMLDALQNGEGRVKGGLSERAAFEVTLLKAVEQSRSRAIDTLIKNITALAADLPPEAGEKKIRAFAETTGSATGTTGATGTFHIPRATAAGTNGVQSSKFNVQGSAGTTAGTASASEDVLAPKLDSVREAAIEIEIPPEPPAPEDAATAGTTEAGAVPLVHERNAEDTAEPLPPSAPPGTPDFQNALDALPEKIRHLLHEEFNASFISLAAIPRRSIISPNAPKPAPATAADISLDDLPLELDNE